MSFFMKAISATDTASSSLANSGFGNSISGRPTSQQIIDLIIRQHGQILGQLEVVDIALTQSSRRNQQKIIDSIKALESILDRHSREEDNLVYKRLHASIAPDSADYKQLQGIERAEKVDRQRVFSFFLNYRNTTAGNMDLPQLNMDFTLFSQRVIGHMELEEKMFFTLLEEHLY